MIGRRPINAVVMVLRSFQQLGSLMDHKASRAPKLLGDFGEGLVTYALIRQGFEVACVDHVGADLIGERSEYKIAVSVKTRMYRQGTVESRSIVFEFDHLAKLEHFAHRFDLDPVLAHAVCIVNDHKIDLFMLRVADILRELEAGQIRIPVSVRPEPPERYYRTVLC